MKTLFRKLLVGIAIVGAASPVLGARGPQNIFATPHNLSSVSPHANHAMYRSANEDEICIFCHTPHGGRETGQLWNKQDPGTSYTHYTSATLSAKVAESRTSDISNESLLCMSCHDGSLSMYIVHNVSNRTAGQPEPADPRIADGRMFSLAGDFGGGYIGDLSNDHPISFSYTAVYNDNRSAVLKDVTIAEGRGVRFFGGDKRVECSSCHDPHVDYDAWGVSPGGNADYRPFLITPNTGSALCLACHTK